MSGIQRTTSDKRMSETIREIREAGDGGRKLPESASPKRPHSQPEPLSSHPPGLELQRTQSKGKRPQAERSATSASHLRLATSAQPPQAATEPLPSANTSKVRAWLRNTVSQVRGKPRDA
jgi:hypothetical protein